VITVIIAGIVPLLAAILGDGINLGLTKVAEACLAPST
jgi:hypothetical protein